MSPSHTQKSGSHILVLGIVLMLVLYVLSLGPVMAIAGHNPHGMAVIRQVYFPIIWLHDHTPLDRVIEGYVNIWE